MKCPCEDCIVWVFCRQQSHINFRCCERINKFLGFEGFDVGSPEDSKKHFKNYPIFYKTLKPIKWSYHRWPRRHPRRNIDFVLKKTNPKTKIWKRFLNTVERIILWYRKVVIGLRQT